MAKKNQKIQAPPAPKRVAVIKQGFIEKNAMKIALVAGVIGLIIRLYRLGYLSLWVDEYMHALAAMGGHFSHGENNGILLTWMNTTLAFVFGHSEFMLRFPVALLGAATIPAVYVLGRDIANYKVGLMSAILTMVSLYLIFWSRVERPYGMVAAFYVPLLVSFWLMLERKDSKENFLSKIGINKKYLLLTFIALVLAMLSQLICFLFVFTVGFYGTMVAVDSWITRKSSPLKMNAYNLLFYINILVVFLMFTPWGGQLTRPVMELFLPKGIVTFILPDYNNIMTLLNSDKWNVCYNTYMGVLDTDFKNLAILGWSGFILAFFKNRKIGYFLLSSFVVPFLLLSFVFTSTSHAKYLIQIYPVFLISAAYALYFIAFHLIRFVSKSLNETNSTYSKACTIIFILLVLGITPFKEIGALIKTETHGSLVDNKLTEISYVNWKQPCLFLKEHRKPNDIVMATVQAAPRYYLEMDSVIWFRQMELNPKWTKTSKTEQKYIPKKADGYKNSATTYEQLVKTYENNDRGWLLADYYFVNAMTDPRARQFVEEKFDYHFEASEDGGVKVFSWDKSKPKTYQTSFVIELGKNAMTQASEEMTFSINKAGMAPKVNLIFLGVGVDTDMEAFVVINGKTQAPILTNGTPLSIGTYTCQTDASAFVQGPNKIQFVYNNDENNGDANKGFALFNMDIR